MEENRMMPVVFVNCKDTPFVDLIICGRKQFETRTKNTLGKLVGKRVLIAETGCGKPVVRCSAVISYAIPVNSQHSWEMHRRRCGISSGSKYNWKPDTKVKWLYRLCGVVACYPFTPPEGIRHGRAWMEYENTWRIFE